MKETLESTASSWGVAASAMRRTAPTPFWIVSSRVRPVKTRMVSCCSSGFSVAQELRVEAAVAQRLRDDLVDTFVLELPR